MPNITIPDYDISELCKKSIQPKGITGIGIGPGYVQTDMTRGGTATLLPDESVRGMIRTFDRINLADTGRFFSWQNQEDKWMTPV